MAWKPIKGKIPFKIDGASATLTKGGKQIVFNQAAINEDWTGVKDVILFHDGCRLAVVRAPQKQEASNRLSHYESGGANLAASGFSKKAKLPPGTKFHVFQGSLLGQPTLILEPRKEQKA